MNKLEQFKSELKDLLEKHAAQLSLFCYDDSSSLDVRIGGGECHELTGQDSDLDDFNIINNVL